MAAGRSDTPLAGRRRAGPRAGDVTSGVPTLSPACRRLRQQRAGLGAPGLKWCGSERRRLRPCVGPWSRRRHELRWPAHAGRPVPAATRRAACCPAPGGLCLRRSARETNAGAARRVAPREFRTAGAGHGGLQVGVAARQLTGSALGQDCPLPAPRCGMRALLLAQTSEASLGWQALWARVTRRYRLRKGFFFLVKCDSARSIWLFSFFFITLLFFGFSSLF